MGRAQVTDVTALHFAMSAVQLGTGVNSHEP
jgi:hypothetical protein